MPDYDTSVEWAVFRSCKFLKSIEAGGIPFPLTWMESASPVWPHLQMVKWSLFLDEVAIEEFLYGLGQQMPHLRIILDTRYNTDWQPQKIQRLFGLHTQVHAPGPWPWQLLQVEEVDMHVVGNAMSVDEAKLDEADLRAAGMQHLRLNCRLVHFFTYSGTFQFSVHHPYHTITWAAPGSGPRCPSVLGSF